MNNNEFVDLSDYIGFYKINRVGEIFNVKRNIIMKLQSNRHGYKVVGLSKNGLRKLYGVHRLLCIQFLENPENKPCVDHIDRNKQNNNLENLRWVTISENCSNKAVSGSIIKNKKCESYQAFYRIEPKNVKRKAFKTVEECEQWLIEIKIQYPR